MDRVLSIASALLGLTVIVCADSSEPRRHYTFDALQRNGEVAPDASAGKFSLRLSGQETGGGIVGQALHFKPGNGEIALGDLGLRGPATLALWLQRSAPQSDMRILSQAEGPPSQAGCLRVIENTLQIWDGAAWLTVVNGVNSTGAWQHVALVVGEDGTVTGYLNGRRSAAVKSGFDYSGVAAGLSSRFAGQYGEHFVGAIDDLRIYGRTLSESEVAALYPDALFVNARRSEETLPRQFTVPPYLQDLSAECVTVMWWSSMGAYGFVEYGETEALGQKADTVIDGMREVHVTRHAVRLSGLKPGTRYWYRTGMLSVVRYNKNSVHWSPTIFSPVYSFVTPPLKEERVRCVILADTHNNATFGPLLSLPGVEPYDFSLFNGDCFGDIKREGPCLELLRAYLELVNGALRPAVFVRGNHEFRNWYGTYLRHLFTWPAGHPYFAFTRGPVRFVVLDCGEAVRDSHPICGGTLDCSSLRVECAAWLEREIASDTFSEARWHVLIVHIPLYGDGCSEHSRPFYLPVLDKAKFDLEVNGHIHVSRLLKPGEAGNPHPVVSVGGFCTAVGVFDATASGWTFNVRDNTGKAVVEVKGGRP